MSWAWAGPVEPISVLCERTMTSEAAGSSEQLLQDTLKTYRLLLEFAGPAFPEESLLRLASESASLEDYFAEVPGADLHHSSLNGSLKLVGDWVLSGDHAMDPTVLRLRLREMVRQHMSRVDEVERQNEVSRQEHRELPEIVRDFMPHGRNLISADFTALPGWVLSSGFGGVRLWDVSGRHEPTAFIAEGGHRVLPFPDGFRFLTYRQGGEEIELRDIRDPLAVRSFKLDFKSGHRGSLWAAGDFVLLGNGPRQAEKRIVNTHNGKVVGFGDWPVLTPPYALSPDGKRFAVMRKVGPQPRLEIWEMPDPHADEQVATRVFVGDAPFSPGDISFGRTSDELLLVTAGEMSYRLYHAQGDRLTPAWEQAFQRRSTSGFGKVLLRRQGTPSLIHAEPGEIRLVDPDTGKVSARLPYPSAMRMLSMSLSPSERLLLVSYADHNTIQIWDLETKTLRFQLDSPFRSQLDAKFSLDEKTLLVPRPVDGGIRVWDLELLEQN